MPRRRLWAGVALTLATFGLVATAVPAAAEPPRAVADRVTDRAEVLDRAERGEVEAAIERLETATTIRLSVVFVERFDAPPSDEDSPGSVLPPILRTGDWAEAAAEQSDLGRDAVLLAIATRQRSYEWSLGDDVPLTTDEVDTMMERDVVPRLAAGEWTDAAVAAARGLADPSGPWWQQAWLLWTAVIAAGVAVVVWLKRAGVTFFSSSSTSSWSSWSSWSDDGERNRSSRRRWSGSSSRSRSSGRRSGGSSRRSGGGRF